MPAVRCFQAPISGVPPVSEVTVRVAESAFRSTWFAEPSSRMRNVLPPGFDACSEVLPSADLGGSTGQRGDRPGGGERIQVDMVRRAVIKDAQRVAAGIRCLQ